MSLILEDWDGSGSLPSGFTYAAGYAISSTEAYSSPHSLAYTNTSGVDFGGCWYDTEDGNLGNVSVSTKFYIPSGAINSSTDAVLILVARSPSRPNDLGVGSTYGYTLEVALTLSGSSTSWFSSITSSQGSTETIIQDGTFTAQLATDAWYEATLTCQGSTISATVVRESDGYYFDGTTWSSTPSTFLSGTDTTITGQGYCGFGIGSGLSTLYTDDFDVELLPLTIDAPAISSAAAFIAPSLTFGVGLTLDAISSAASFPTPDFLTSIAAPAIASAATFPEPSITAAESLTLNAIPSAATFPEPSIIYGFALDAIASAAVVPEPSIGVYASITLPAIPSAANFPGDPYADVVVVTPSYALTLDGITSAATFPEPTVSVIPTYFLPITVPAGSVAETLVGFPLSVRAEIPPSHFAGDAAHLYCVDTSGDVLPYKLVSWDGTTVDVIAKATLEPTGTTILLVYWSG